MEVSIPVDLLNPGQVFACLGFLEAADVLLGAAEGAFDWSTDSGVRFWLRAGSDESPILHVLRFLAGAQAFADVPAGSACASGWKGVWGELRTLPEGKGYPFPVPATPATVRCILSDGHRELALDYWGDVDASTRRDNVKFWAGAGGYPGAALARDALELARPAAIAHSADPFALAVPQSSSFRLDWRRDYVPIDAGFSLNEHQGRITAVGYPLVELLGALGLGNARPRRVDRRDKLRYDYGVAGRHDASELWLSPSLLRAALGGGQLPVPMRRFRMFLGWPGKEGQARAITTVREEISE